MLWAWLKICKLVVSYKNQSCTGKKGTEQSVLVLFMSLVEMNLKWTYLYKCFQTATHPCPSYLSSLPHKDTPSGVARIRWERLFLQGSQPWSGTEVWLLWRGPLFAGFSWRVGRLGRCASEASPLGLCRWGTSIHENTLEHVLLEICSFQCVFTFVLVKLHWDWAYLAFTALGGVAGRCWHQLLFNIQQRTEHPSDALDSYPCSQAPKLSVEEYGFWLTGGFFLAQSYFFYLKIPICQIQESFLGTGWCFTIPG